ncbi:MAG: N-formylglutamate amidohydrolase [Marinosulfonomonas sp.]
MVALNKILLTREEGPAAEVINPDGAANIILVCEHASSMIPASLSGLGLSAEDRVAHIAWDPGALAVAKNLSDMLDAPLVVSRVSRLVYDCNRPPSSPEAMRDKSEIYDIPGNKDLSSEDRDLRVRAVYEPFQTLLHDVIEERADTAPTIVTVHSFTPTYFGAPRAVQIGLLHDTDDRLAEAMLATAPEVTKLQTMLNRPYGPEDGVTHTLVEHACSRGLLNVMIEIRNDLVTTTTEVDAMSEILSKMITTGRKTCAATTSDQQGGDERAC